MINKKTYIYKTCSLVLLIIISLFTLGMDKSYTPHQKKIFKNIAIEDISIGNLTMEEAKRKIKETYFEKNIKIKYKDKLFEINYNDINLNFNIEEAIKEAYNYTRQANNIENIKRMFSLMTNKTYNIRLHATYNENELSDLLNKICDEINVDVVQATIKIKDNSQIDITESKEGINVDIIKLKELIYNMIQKKCIDEIDLPIKVINPKVTTEDVKSINSVLGQHSTSFNHHTSRGNNIYVAGQSTSDILIMPGEIFSYNETTGARTYSNGYKTAKVIVGGKYVNGEGGGVCQVSTTIYNASLIAGMKIEEVHNHTFPSRYASKGKDAAVSYGYTDFKFKNLNEHPIYIKNILRNGVITSKIYGCSEDKQRVYIRTEEKYNEDKIFVNTYRVYLDKNNEKIKEELISKSKYKTK